jgi:hypothetical protein
VYMLCFEAGEPGCKKDNIFIKCKCKSHKILMKNTSLRQTNHVKEYGGLNSTS